MTIDISVVVPTYRRDTLLRRCLERLLAQMLLAERYEVIVCDDGPSESTRELVARLASSDCAKLRYVPVTATQGPAGARNAGWRAARGEFIAFTDDDCLPEPQWLSAGLAALQQADAATGRTIVPLPEAPTDYELDTAGLASAEFITANCFCRRSDLAAIGGFDERFTSAWREDSDLHFALLERGKRIARAGDAVVVHPVRPAAWGVSLKLQRKGVFDPLLWRKHPQLYRRHIPRFPRQYVATTAALVASPLALLAGFPWLSLGATVVWLAFTFEFAWRRLRRTSKSPSHIADMLFTSALIPSLSLYWRLVGLWRYGRGNHTESPNKLEESLWMASSGENARTL
jgi:glycosyltransferase involved in cell wall biosynthesis